MYAILTTPRFHSFIPPAIIVAVIFNMLSNDPGSKDISLLLVIYLVGAGGGVVSTYLRLKSMPDESFTYNKDSKDRLMAILQVYMSPVIAGVFAWLLYGLFATGILKGTMFPNFIGAEKVYYNVVQLFQDLKPEHLEDTALAILWAFIAGFSEKMLPNILDKLASQVEESDAGDPEWNR
ncbi:hypothetical protein [Maridesulfovibrio salexigens]|uniref:Uncharacterized protein n=1 Tax=Maridesulfovibrio salexigens (strain ATCC 14822 / DSM 2638 / NCIMB 8403 / VKM B-1763) TaxID=526222 RepID=C6C0G3_MARSD|nr:hypothetical protein [Maridesulfovibrio salexigens]ACS79097.1 conserved hypothetical protein [Maridesulfovibrio salexigens DSM 2638]